jgi:hypothetical protein
LNTEAALAEPSTTVRRAPAPRPRGFARFKSAAERTWWDSLEYLESATQRHAARVLFAGSEKRSGAPLRLLYFGSGNHLAWVRDLAFREWRVEEKVDGIRIWNARRSIAAFAQRADIVVADLPWPWHRALRGAGMVEVPAWVNQRFALPANWTEVAPRLRRSARGEDMRSIRKNRLEYRLVRDDAAIRRFYEEMYVPHLTRRFGEAAYIEPEWKIRYCVEHGTLMEIRREGKLVAAQVLWGSRGSLHFLWAGTTGEDSGAGTRGVFPALYYYGIVHGFENGFDEVDYCGSRPVLADGIFQIKRRWGAAVFDGWSRDSLFIRPRTFQGAARDFLAGNPFIARSGVGLVGRLLCPGAATAEDVGRAEQLYASDGIREIRIYSAAPPAPDALEAARSTSGVKIVDLSREPDPLAAYCGG